MRAGLFRGALLADAGCRAGVPGYMGKGMRFLLSGSTAMGEGEMQEMGHMRDIDMGSGIQ